MRYLKRINETSNAETAWYYCTKKGKDIINKLNNDFPDLKVEDISFLDKHGETDIYDTPGGFFNGPFFDTIYRDGLCYNDFYAMNITVKIDFPNNNKNYLENYLINQEFIKNFLSDFKNMDYVNEIHHIKSDSVSLKISFISNL